MKSNAVKLAAVALLIAGTSADARDREWRSALKGTGDFKVATGSVLFRDRGAQLEIRVEMQGIKLPQGTLLAIRVDGELIGSVKLSNRQVVRFQLRSSEMPGIVSGAKITIDDDGTVVVEGTLR